MEVAFPFILILAFAVFVVVIVGWWLVHLGVFAAVVGAIRRSDRIEDRRDETQRARADGRYSCRLCGASVEDGSMVSPSGDYRCTHCGKWSNVHRPS